MNEGRKAEEGRKEVKKRKVEEGRKERRKIKEGRKV